MEFSKDIAEQEKEEFRRAIIAARAAQASTEDFKKLLASLDSRAPQNDDERFEVVDFSEEN